MSLSQIDLNLLLVLDTVLTQRSVARAARHLHVTPSAISNALARLRHVLGDPLVLRSGRGIVPTPRAAALAPLLARALGDVERAIDATALDPRTTARQFTLAVADAGQLVHLPRLAARFAGEMPRARLRVVGIDTLLSSGGLAGTEVDLALAALEETTPGVHTTPLYEEQSVLVGRRGHPLTGATLSKAELAALRHVEVQVAPGRGYRQLAPAYARLGIERDVALVVPSFTAAAAVVAATDFVSTLPESFVKRHGATFGVHELTASAPRVSIAIKLAWHDRTEHDPLMRAFRAIVSASVLSTVRARGSAGKSRPR